MRHSVNELNVIASKQGLGKAFIFRHKIYFNETNAVGGVAYFSNFIKWQGMVREDYFISTVPQWRDIMKHIALGQLNMITVEEHSHFIQHAFFGDEILVNLFTANIKKYSFDMLFFMYHAGNNNLLYEGFQRLAFDNFNGKFVEIPKPMLESARQNEISQTSLQASKLKKYFS